MYMPLCPHFGRAYTEGFIKELLRCFESRGPFTCMLRTKQKIDSTCTDRSIFEALPLGDVWIESKMHLAWAYIYNNKYMVVPDSWQTAIQSFNKELVEKAFWLHIVPNSKLGPSTVPYSTQPPVPRFPFLRRNGRP